MSCFLEDYEIGRVTELGAHLFTAEDIVRFARAFDPQPFHLDAAAAAASHFGGLCASGWHTASVWMRLMVEHRKREAARAEAEGRIAGRVGPSPGFEDLRWLKPVYAGDTIAFRNTTEGARPLASRPGWGLVSSLNEGFNQDGVLVFSFKSRVFVPRRGVEETGPPTSLVRPAP